MFLTATIKDISGGEFVDIYIFQGGTITESVLVADQVGSIEVELTKDSLADAPPSSGDDLKILSIDNDVFSSDTDRFRVETGDVLRINVNSVTDITQISVNLNIK